MANAIAITSEGGVTLIELSAEPQVISTSSEGTAGVADLAEKLDHVAGTIVKICSSLHDQAYAALGAMRPDAFELEFGICLVGEAGVPLVTKGTAECTFKVTAKWESVHREAAKPRG